jgi:drug/metabolite transporter (DMT)-like permease
MENFRGIALMVLAMGGFAIEDVLVKTVSQHVPVGQVLLVLLVLGSAFFTGLTKYRGLPLYDRTFLHPGVIGRNICEALGTMCFVLAIVLLPRSLASSVFQAMPLAITLGAALFLKEPVGWRRWSAIFVGFVGVLLIIRPGFDAFDPLSLLAVASVFFLAGRDLFSRIIPKDITDVQLSSYGFTVVIPCALAMLWFSDGVVTPTGQQWVMMIGASVFGVLAYYALTAASRLGEVAVITPFRYSRLIFALFFAYVIFDERPDGWTLFGAALIIASGIYTLWRERKRGQISKPMDAETVA